jgi:hypothetical protein
MRLARSAGRCFVAIVLATPWLAAAQTTAPAIFESPNVSAPTQPIAPEGSFTATRTGIPSAPAQQVASRTAARQLPQFIARQKLLQNHLVQGLMGTFGADDVMPGQRERRITVSPSMEHGGFSIHMTLNLGRRDHTAPEPQR